MSMGRIVISLIIGTAAVGGLSGCGTLTRGLGYFTSAGLVDEYAIPQNRSLAMPTDFSRLPTPQNEVSQAESLPTPDEIEALVFTLEPEAAPEEQYRPITVIADEVPQYQPIGRIVASGSNGAATQFQVSTQTNSGGSIFPVAPVPPTAAAPIPVVATPVAAPAAAATASEPAMVPLTAEQAAALAAMAVEAPVPVIPATSEATPAAVGPDAAPALQWITSLPAGVSMMGEPVVVSR
ncbi:MAG: hypothetical protein VX077_10445 [Pseudomonadota bacterium]|nr:hypothetical protein [Pseudomonadota bacterium]